MCDPLVHWTYYRISFDLIQFLLDFFRLTVFASQKTLASMSNLTIEENTHLTKEQYIYPISLKSNKIFYATGDFNLNVLDYHKNEKVKKFLNLTFEYGLVPVIKKPTRVTKNTVTAIDNIIIKLLLRKTINTWVIKFYILDNFPLFLIVETENRMIKKIQIKKYLIDKKWHGIM